MLIRPAIGAIDRNGLQHASYRRTLFTNIHGEAMRPGFCLSGLKL